MTHSEPVAQLPAFVSWLRQYRFAHDVAFAYRNHLLASRSRFQA